MIRCSRTAAPAADEAPAELLAGGLRLCAETHSATEGIASGNFQVELPSRANDELGRLGQAIRTMAARLDQLVTGQKHFLGDAAHELCAPLARLRTGLGILEMKLGASAPADLESIEAEAAELAALVEEILAFSRARGRQVRPVAVPLEPLVREAAAREQADGRLIIDLPAGLAVSGDPGLLTRAIGNILRNSRVHAGPAVEIRVTATAGDGRVILSLADNGPGAPADELARIFEPFYRPDRSRSREAGGCGLGLAIVRTAAEACGGSASADLPDGGGFAVRLELPSA